MHPFILFIQEIHVECLLCDQHQRQSHDRLSSFWLVEERYIGRQCRTAERAPVSAWGGAEEGGEVQGAVRQVKGTISVH